MWNLILSTDYSKDISEFKDQRLCKILHDVDFGILARDKKDVLDYDSKIRLEYKVPDKIFVPARLKFLEGLLEKENIYYICEWNTIARENVNMLINRYKEK